MKKSLTNGFSFLFLNEMSQIFKYNKKNFTVSLPEQPLLELYTKLITLELFLKENLSSFTSHDQLKDKLIEFLNSINNGTAITPKGDLDLLKNLWVYDRNGIPKQNKDIGKSSYPNIRYIRHNSDYQDAIDTSSEDDIKVCLKEVKQIYE